MKKRIILLILLLLIISPLAYGEKPIKEKLYIGGREGLYIVKFEKLDKLTIQGHTERDMIVLTAEKKGDYLFLGSKRGISIYSLKDPDNPQLISKFIPKLEEYMYPSSYPHRIFIERNKAYIPYGISGVLILNIENEKVPEKIGIYNDNTPFYDAVVKDKYIYAFSSSGLVIINAKDPGSPKKIKTLMPLEKKEGFLPLSLLLNDNYLIVGKKDSLYIYNIENPEEPVLLKTKKVGDLIEKLYLEDEYLFVIDDKGFTLRVFTIKFSKKKTKKGTKIIIDISKKGVYKANYPIRSVLYFRDFIYLAMGKYGVEIVNMDHLEKIFKKVSLNIYTDCVSISVGPKFSYAVDTKEGLIVIDKEKITPINWYGTLQEATDFYKTERYGYLLQKGRLSALSIKDDGEPYRIDSTWKVPERAFRLYVEKDRIYVASLDYGLFIYDTKKDPTAPKLIKKYATDGNLYDIYTEGDILYVADGKAGFFVLDTKDPEEIRVYRKYKTKSPILSLYKFQDSIYLGERDGTLEIISLENPKKIEIIGKLKFNSPIMKIKKWGNHLFLAMGRSGVEILKISSPYSLPEKVAKIQTNGYVWDMDLKENKLWIADGENGVTVYDLKNIPQPKRLKDLDWFSANVMIMK